MTQSNRVRSNSTKQ